MYDRASRELARKWDARDPLARFRKLFFRPSGQIYFKADSLGLSSVDAERSILRVLADWKSKAAEGWNDGDTAWSNLPLKLAARIARLIGAESDEVAIGNSVAVNLHQLLATIYRRQFHRPRILVDGFEFSSNRVAVRSHLELRGLGADHHLVEIGPDHNRRLDEGKIEAAMMDPMLQMALLPSVVGATGQLLDLPRLAQAARTYGVLLGLDLSHSLGVMPHALDDWGIDFAIWGHDKFMNAGPGAAGGLYLNRRHFGAHNPLEPGLAGGFDERLNLPNEKQMEEDAASLQIGAPSILSLAPVEGALRLLEEAGLERVRAKSLDLTHFLRSAIEQEIPGLHFATAKESAQRGGHLALVHPNPRIIGDEARRNGLSIDFRSPDVISLAPAPLYNSFVECWDAAQILRRVVEAEASEQPEPERALAG
jgi:kynureninase